MNAAETGTASPNVAPPTAASNNAEAVPSETTLPTVYVVQPPIPTDEATPATAAAPLPVVSDPVTNPPIVVEQAPIEDSYDNTASQPLAQEKVPTVGTSEARKSPPINLPDDEINELD